MNEQRDDIRDANEKNAMAKHLEIHHPENDNAANAFKFNVHANFAKALDRQVFEGTLITNTQADIVMNSKSEFHQPAVTRITTTREVPERQRGL